MATVIAMAFPQKGRRISESVQVVEIPQDLPKGTIFVPEEYRERLAFWCDRAGVPYSIMARVAFWESGWDPYADNGSDAGLFQLNRRYYNDFSAKFNEGHLIDPFDVDISMKVACRYMRWLYLQTGDYRDAVMSYNCGLTRMRDKPPAVTVRYMHLVFGDK